MKRAEQIKLDYIRFIDAHLDDLISNQADTMLEIEEFAEKLHIHPTHLTNTMTEISGTSACGIYQLKIMERALRLLSDSSLNIQDVAGILTYEPSQFTKWFKRINGLTPKQYRLYLNGPEKGRINSEIMTILKSYADIPLRF